jgi:hypothetical protein
MFLTWNCLVCVLRDLIIASWACVLCRRDNLAQKLQTYVGQFHRQDRKGFAIDPRVEIEGAA